MQEPQTTRLPPRAGVGPGDLLAGRYRLQQLIGWGGQALVFEASNLRPGTGKYQEPKRLAIKVARIDQPPPGPQDAATVIGWEATLLRRLSHPALPHVWRSAGDGALVWLARDLVPGRSLAGTGRHDPRHVHAWAIQLCELLRYLHTLSPAVICGDIKPSNLILRPDGTLMLIDLGAAHTRTRQPPRRPRPRHGTPGYAPPEQLGAWGMDERADIFSLAVTCYELLTGIDPTRAPLQFDLALLDTIAPQLAPALRWGLALDPARRVPTAAALLAALTTPPPVAPLQLRAGAQVLGAHDLLTMSMRHPQSMEAAIGTGALERWLAEHPDPQLGTLMHRLRRAQTEVPPKTRRLDVLLTAMAPADGSPLLSATPGRVAFGPIPPPRWRVWSPPQRLTLRNGAQQPLRWELICPRQLDADLRVLVEGKPSRHWAGVILPHESAELELVAVGRQGQRQGTLTLRCGSYTTTIPWEGEGVAGVPVNGRMVVQLKDLDLSQPDLLPALEELVRNGALQRWLNAQGLRTVAAQVASAGQQALDPMALRQLVVRVLHPLSPIRFPLLQPSGDALAGVRVLAGGETQATLDVTNIGEHPSVVTWASKNPWVRITPDRVVVAPGERRSWLIVLSPPAAVPAGPQNLALELVSGNLVLPITVSVQVVVEHWWQRVRRWIGS